MGYFKETFSESGQGSMMRLLAFMLVFTGIGIGIAGLLMNKALPDVAILAGVFIGAGIGGKFAQSISENKYSNEVTKQ